MSFTLGASTIWRMSPAPLEIRRFQADDLEATVAVWKRSRIDNQPWLEERMGYTHEQDLGHFRDVISQRFEVWIGTEAGAIVGLAAFADGRLDQLYVDPDAQRRGVGTALLQHVMQRTPGRLRLFTHQRNQRARRFYESRGLRIAAFGVSPAPEGEPDLEYVWDPEQPAPELPTLLGVVVLIPRGERWLLIERGAEVEFGGMWAPMSGKVEPGEAPRDAVVREVREELGIGVRAVREVWECPTDDGRYRLLWWLVEPEDAEPKLAPDPREVADTRWLTRDEILVLPKMFDADRRFFDEVLPGIHQGDP